MVKLLPLVNFCWNVLYMYFVENGVLFSNDTGKLGKRNSECSHQESNLRPSDYKFGCSTTELQETCGTHVHGTRETDVCLMNLV